MEKAAEGVAVQHWMQELSQNGRARDFLVATSRGSGQSFAQENIEEVTFASKKQAGSDTKHTQKSDAEPVGWDFTGSMARFQQECLGRKEK